MKTRLRILYIHGMESGINGAKVQYLRRHFDHVDVPDLKTGGINFRANSFLSAAVWNFQHIFSGNYFGVICDSILQTGVDEVREFLLSIDRPDVIVASSLGGAIALEAARQNIFDPNTPILLLAPALKRIITGSILSGDVHDDENRQNRRMQEWYASFGGGSEGSKNRGRMVVAHGELDSTVRLEDSRELCSAIGATLMEVPDGDHPLNDYLLDGVSKVTGESQRDKLYPMVLDLVRNDTISN